MMSIKCYTDLKQLSTFDERLEYLMLYGTVAHETFGYNRFMNQDFYRSREWKQAREIVIVRDYGCDLGIPGFELDKIYIHHMNPITEEDIKRSSDFLMNPEFLISVSDYTHNAIHYGLKNVQPRAKAIERKPNDTRLW